MSNCFRSLLLLGCSALIGTTLPASASTITYADVASWTSAVTSPSTILFNGLAPTDSIVTFNNSSGYVSSGVTFTGVLSTQYNTFDLSAVDPGYASPYYNFGSNAILLGPSNDRSYLPGTFVPYVHIVLPGTVTAFSALLGSQSPNGTPIQVTLSDGEQFNASTPSTRSTSFFGLTTNSPISYINLALPTSAYNGGTHLVLQQFQFGTTSGSGSSNNPGDMPEAASMILIGTGLIFMWRLRKRLKPFRLAHA